VRLPAPDLEDADAVSAAYDWLREGAPLPPEPEDETGEAWLLALFLLLGGASRVWGAAGDTEIAGVAWDNAARRTILRDLRRHLRRSGGALGLASDGAVQTVYGAGRRGALGEPAALRRRHLWTFDAVLDERTSELCRSLHGTTLPASDPWWNAHTPPLHPNCRSGIRARSEGAVTIHPPEAMPVEGWGRWPEAPFRPDPTAFPPELWAAFRGRLASRPGP
jgi:SPP1 gp7 family putative phage head morphogenesis protein